MNGLNKIIGFSFIALLSCSGLLGQIGELDFTFNYPRNEKKNKCTCKVGYEVIRKIGNSNSFSYHGFKDKDYTLNDNFTDKSDVKIIVRLISTKLSFQGKKCPNSKTNYYLDPIVDYNKSHFELENKGSTRFNGPGGYYPIIFKVKKGNEGFSDKISIKYQVKLRGTNELIEKGNRDSKIEFDYNITPPSSRIADDPKPKFDEQVWKNSVIPKWEQYLAEHNKRKDNGIEVVLLGFVDGYPDSKHKNQGITFLKEFYHDQLTRLDNESKIRDFIEKYPRSEQYGGYITKARNIIDDLNGLSNDKDDRDGDGFPNDDDNCPDEYGDATANGCPDKDGDGVKDSDDNCDNQRGPATNNGCPIDKDGNDWAIAKSLNSLAGYRDYKNKHPNGKFVTEANDMIGKIINADDVASNRLDAALRRAGDDIIERCKAYAQYLRETQVNSKWYKRRNEATDYRLKECDEDIFFLEATFRPKDGSVLLEVTASKVNNTDDLKVEFIRNNQSIPENNYVVKPRKISNGKFEFIISYIENGRNSFTVTDLNATQRTATEEIIISSIQPQVEEIDNGRMIRISGAEGPYMAIGLDENNAKLGEVVPIGPNEPTNQRIFVKPNFKNEKVTHFSVTAEKATITDKAIGIGPSSVPTLLRNIILGSLIAILVLIVIFRKKIEHALRSNPTARAVFSLSPPKKKQTEEDEEGKKEGNDDDYVPVEEGILISNHKKESDSELAETGAIKISKKKIIIPPANMSEQTPVQAKDSELLRQFENLSHYLKLDLNLLWKDSIVTSIHMGLKFAATLNKVMQDEADRRDMNGDDHPEIGGFILGRTIEAADGTYLVSFEEYIPAPTERHDAYEIEFAAPAYHELDNALERYPHLKTVGWFHTHPGHGLFLSNPDLKIQRGFFKKPYHIAMEIDTLSRHYDVAFFSWKKDMTINNSNPEDRAQYEWFSWDTVNQWRRQKYKFISNDPDSKTS
jgi:proteasome lid subunit RPN8/RPN11